MSSYSSPATFASGTLLPQTNERAFLEAPVRQYETVKHNGTTGKDETSPISTPTIRERRGRKARLPSGTYRPLSVFTTSFLAPFNLDTDKAFDVLKSESPDRLEQARTALTLEAHQEKQESKHLQQQTTPSRSTGMVQRREDNRNPGTSASSGDFDIDLITALKTTSPEKDTGTRISADFAVLCELPIPEVSQHPMLSSDPFAVKNEVPLLFSSTNIDEIRLFNRKNTSRRSSSTRFGRDSVERKRSFFGLDFRTPSSVKSRNAFAMAEDSSPPFAVPAPSTNTPVGSVKSVSPRGTDAITSKENAISTSASSSVRKLSDLFRKKESMEKAAVTSGWSPRNSQESPNLERQDLVR